MDALNDEVLFVGTAEAEHVEMYLKAIWHIKERGEDYFQDLIYKSPMLLSLINMPKNYEEE